MVKVLVRIDSWRGPIARNGENIPQCGQGEEIIVEDQTWEDMQKHHPNGFSFVEKIGESKSMKPESTPESKPSTKETFKDKMVRRVTLK